MINMFLVLEVLYCFVHQWGDQQWQGPLRQGTAAATECIHDPKAAIPETPQSHRGPQKMDKLISQTPFNHFYKKPLFIY